MPEPALEPTTPSSFEMFGGLLGGAGLFLLGMYMLTEGLKLAAGRALAGMLEHWTSTPVRGLGAGILITALVQSSTAVTVAGIGFVNAGLLSLKNALWVIFGSNVGTTMNAWLVAALGFGFKIDAFALPFVGIGAALMLATAKVRPRALGQALAGFGVLFLGIDVLKDTFSAFGAGIDLQQFIVPGLPGWAMLVAIGTLITILLQASGAAIAIIITSAQTGLISTEAACAMVIGTNIGTTFTAVLSAIGATANARRLAAAHVFFNLITGAVALLLLPALIALLGALSSWFDQPATPAVMVAMFHTAFNLLGVALMVPSSRRLLDFLSARFRSGDEEISRPQHLDANSVSIPDLALRALRMEIGRTHVLAGNCLRAAVHTPPDATLIARNGDALTTLALAIGDYTRKVTSASLPPALVEALARNLRALQYQETALETTRMASELGIALGRLPEHGLARALETFRHAVEELADASVPGQPAFKVSHIEHLLAVAEERYAALKEALLNAGAHARMDIRSMQEWLRLASLLRRATEQIGKSARTLAALEEGQPQPAVGHNGDQGGQDIQ